MHIEFRMPIVETIIQRERLEPLYQQVGIIIHEEVAAWAHKYTISTTWSQVGDTIKIEFPEAKHYTWFRLTWQPKSHATSWQRITMVNDVTA
jgi:hypothetical protein